MAIPAEASRAGATNTTTPGRSHQPAPKTAQKGTQTVTPDQTTTVPEIWFVPSWSAAIHSETILTASTTGPLPDDAVRLVPETELAARDAEIERLRGELADLRAAKHTLADVLADIEQHDTDYPARYPLVIEAMHRALAEGHEAGIGIDWLGDTGYQVVVYIELPTGQVSWHMPEHLKPWDGHTTEEKYRRIRRYRSVEEAERD